MMKKSIKNISILACLVTILILPYFVFAQSSALSKLQTVGKDSGYSPNTDQYTIADIAGVGVSIFFSLLGLIFIILILYGGYNWMSAAGDNSKVEKAKDTIRRAVIGLIIITGSYAIWTLISTGK